jgi:hypothetical protein
MKRKILPSILSLALSMALFSCDEVDKNEYFTSSNFVKNENCPTQVNFDPVPANPHRISLLEEFTGHKCGNCPKASKEAKGLLANDDFKDKLIVIAVHGDDPVFNKVDVGASQYFYDFSTNMGKEIDNHFKVHKDGLPKGLVNRAESNGKLILSKSKWKPALETANGTAPVAWLDVKGSFVGEDICSNVRVSMLKNYSNKININVVLIEDDIINWQKDYEVAGENVEDYNHSHILRGSSLGTWGISLPTDITSKSGNVYNLEEYVIPMKNTDWNKEKLSLVAYIYDNETKEILQAQMFHLPK